MRTILVAMVLVMAAILPNPVKAGDDLISTAATLAGIYQMTRDFARAPERPQNASVSYGNQLSTITRRVVIDEKYCSFQGAGDWWLKENIVETLRLRAKRSGIEVKAAGETFKDVTELQDQINNSGRYSVESRRRVPTNQMDGPEELFKIVANSSIGYRRNNINVRQGRNGVSLEYQQVEATIRLTVSPVGLKSGDYGQGYEGIGTVKKTIEFGFSGGNWSNYGGYRTQRDLDSAIFLDAASDAVDEVIAQMAADTQAINRQASQNKTTQVNPGSGSALGDQVSCEEPPVQPVLVSDPSTRGQVTLYGPTQKIPLWLSPEKTLYPGHIISYYDESGEHARYKVERINGQNVAVSVIKKENVTISRLVKMNVQYIMM